MPKNRPPLRAFKQHGDPFTTRPGGRPGCENQRAWAWVCTLVELMRETQA